MVGADPTATIHELLQLPTLILVGGDIIITMYRPPPTKHNMVIANHARTASRPMLLNVILVCADQPAT